MPKERFSKSELIAKLVEVGRGAKLPFLDFADTLVEELPGVTNEELVEIAVNLKKIDGVARRAGEPREFVEGEGALFFDLVMILGAERGIWDEMGYSTKISSVRESDWVYSRNCEKMIRGLVRQEKFPLLVFFILELKRGIRRIDNEALGEILRVATGRWSFQVEPKGELLEWRLATLVVSVTSVLIDRGFVPNKVQSKNV